MRKIVQQHFFICNSAFTSYFIGFPYNPICSSPHSFKANKIGFNKTSRSDKDFKISDLVWYAGDLTRDGSNAEYQAVDSRIISLKPKSINNAQVAALPLTAITAWKMLFHRLDIRENQSGNLLIIGGEGGVGSIAIQLLKTKTTIIATASRKETKSWVKSLGAGYIIDHSKD